MQLLSRVEPAAESAVRLTLAQAVLKGDKMDDVVRDAVMLGVAAIQPIVTRRTEATVAALMRGARLDRWRRIALASVKQSRRAVLPEIRVPLTFETYLDEPAPALRLMLVEPGADIAAEPLGALRGERAPSDAALLVGPEGGWDDAECAVARRPGAAHVSRATDASRRRRPGCGDQRAAVPLGGRGVRVLGASWLLCCGSLSSSVR